MSYLVLARKYRPTDFIDVIGQAEITDKLKTALASGRTAHAYLFCGPRGVGKTTCARILAKELNTSKEHDQSSFDLGIKSAFDVIEIDGASNNSVDDIRTLRENAQLMPMGGGVKVYIIDEVHMLSPAAFNALLKTLEEPPAHVKFVFATTEPNKLPLTVISRCQRFDFRRIPLELMVKYLKNVCIKESFHADEDALFAIAKAAQGSLRDALSVLDQLSSTSSGEINLLEVNTMLGVVETEQLFALAEALLRKDFTLSLKIFNNIIDQGKDVKQLSHDLMSLFRNLMIMKVDAQDLQDLIDYSASYKKMLYSFTSFSSMTEILFIIDMLIESQNISRIIEMPHLALELALAKTFNGSNVPIPEIKKSTIVATMPTTTILSSVTPHVPPEKNIKPYINKNPVILTPILSEQPQEFSSTVLLTKMLQDWHTITHAVCQHSMSVGTYLQEGRPLRLNGQKLTIGFNHENEFHKEFLDQPTNIKIITTVILEVLKLDLSIELILTDNFESAVPAAVNDALTMFGGEVVNEWDSEDGLSESH